MKKTLLQILLFTLLLLGLCTLVSAEELPSKGSHVHYYILEILQEPSHGTEGLGRYICNCGDSYTVSLPAQEHVYEETVVQTATCSEEGLLRYTCACGDSYDAVLPKTEHAFENVFVAPTCTDNGVELLRCSACGEEQTVRSLDLDPDAEDLLALSHDYQISEQTEPTEDEDGRTVYTCTRCGNSYTAVLEHANKHVARMYVCAKRMISPLGHMWVYIQNLTDRELQVGAYTLPPEQGVSIGSFALTRADGFGLYYNVEAYCVNKYGIKSMICMEQKLTEKQLEKISTRILNGNFWTLILYNCMGAAFSIWDAGPGQKLIPLLFPFIGRLEMMAFPHDDHLSMYYPTENQVFKQKGNGKNATLVKVKQSSLQNGI